MAKETMRAWQYATAAGGIEKNMTLAEEVPRPYVSPRRSDKQVVVEVLSMSLNAADYKVPEMGAVARLAIRMPATPGFDFAGRVAAVSSNVDSFAIGQLVFGRIEPSESQGTLGEYVVVNEASVVALPQGVELDDAAAAVTCAMAASQMLRPTVKAGDKVFINGGSGGIGVYAIQIAKLLGASVTTSCSAANAALCRGLGADKTLDYAAVDVSQALRDEGQVYSVVIDAVGASPPDLYKAADDYMLPGGRFCQIGGEMNLTDSKVILSRALMPSFMGGGKRKFELFIVKTKHEDIVQIGNWLKEKKIRSVIDSTFEFVDGKEAVTKMKARQKAGKIVVHVGKK